MTARESRDMALSMAATAEEASNEADRRASALMMKGDASGARIASKDSARLFEEAQAYRRMALLLDAQAIKEASE